MANICEIKLAAIPLQAASGIQRFRNRGAIKKLAGNP